MTGLWWNHSGQHTSWLPETQTISQGKLVHCPQWWHTTIKGTNNRLSSTCLLSQQTAAELNVHGDTENNLYFNYLGSKVASALAGWMSPVYRQPCCMEKLTRSRLSTSLFSNAAYWQNNLNLQTPPPMTSVMQVDLTAHATNKQISMYAWKGLFL